MAYGGMETRTVTIANSASLSDAVELGGRITSTLVAIITPSGWTSAGLEFQGATTLGGTYYDLYTTSGVKVATSAISASAWVALDPADFAGVPFIKVRSATSGVAVNQTGGDVLTLVVRSL